MTIMPPPKWNRKWSHKYNIIFLYIEHSLKGILQVILCTVHAIVSALMKREDYQRQGCTIRFNRINPSYSKRVGSFSEYDWRQQEELASAQLEHNFTITTHGH